MPSSVLLVLARYPELGRVKTRLAVGVGEERALAVYERLLRRTGAAAAAVADRGVAVTVHVTPADRTSAMRIYIPDSRVGVCPQPDGSLGERLEAAFALAFAGGADRVLAIGADCPDLDAQVIREALQRLDGIDAVLGPSTDGGYYLVGLSRPRPEIFRDVPWSTDAVLRVTLDRLHAQGAHVALLARLSDLDTADDLAALALSRPWLLDRSRFALPAPLSRRSGLPPLGEANRCEQAGEAGERVVHDRNRTNDPPPPSPSPAPLSRRSGLPPLGEANRCEQAGAAGERVVHDRNRTNDPPPSVAPKTPNAQGPLRYKMALRCFRCLRWFRSFIPDGISASQH